MSQTQNTKLYASRHTNRIAEQLPPNQKYNIPRPHVESVVTKQTQNGAEATAHIYLSDFSKIKETAQDNLNVRCSMARS